MATELITYTTDAEWHALRASVITSTDCDALFGMSPYMTPFELWHEKRAARAGDFTDNERMEAGRFFEPSIAAWVAHRYGVIVEPFKVFAIDREARIGSSFDYRIIGLVEGWTGTDETLRDLFRAHGPGLVECKNLDYLIYRRSWTDESAPDHIEAQAQHQMELAGYEWSVIAAVVSGNRLEILVRMRNRKVGAGIRAKARAFWLSIDANEPPEPSMPDDAAYVISLYQDADASQAPLDLSKDEDAAEQVKQYLAARLMIDEFETQCDEIKAAMFMRAGTAPKVITSAGTINMGEARGTPDVTITTEMVGQTIKGRAGYRMFRITLPKPPKEQTSVEP